MYFAAKNRKPPILLSPTNCVIIPLCLKLNLKQIRIENRQLRFIYYKDQKAQNLLQFSINCAKYNQSVIQANLSRRIRLLAI